MGAIFKYVFVIFVLCIWNTVCQMDVQMTMNTTYNDLSFDKRTVANIYSSALKPVVNCSMISKFPKVKDYIALLAAANKLIRVNVNIIGHHGPLNDTYPVSVYKPHQWFISTSLTGNSILMLKEYFDAMSLGTLGYGVASASLDLIQEPSDCLKDAQVESIENSLRIYFLTNFEGKENGLPEEAGICNAHVIQQDAGKGKISYVCCSINLGNTLQCLTLEKSVWFKLLFISINVLQALVVLYSPYLIPSSVYKDRHVFYNYIFRTEKPIELKVIKITENDNVGNGFVETKQHSFAHLEKFKSQIIDAKMSPRKVYSLYVERVDIAVRGSKLTAEGNAPVSVLSFLRNFFVRCKLRFEVNAVEDCCNQNVFKRLPCNFVLHWHKCLGLVMRLLFAAVILSPWLVRIWFYYVYEAEVTNHQRKVLQNRNMTLPYTGNMLSYLSPTHSIYIGIYLLILTESLLYAFVPASVERKLKFTVSQCIRDMRNTQKLDACGCFVVKILLPLNEFGIFGCLVLPLWLLVALPLLLLYLALKVFPIVNLSVRLLVNSLYYTIRTINPRFFKIDERFVERRGLRNRIRNRVASLLVVNFDEKNDRRNQIMQAASLILSFVTMWAILFILIDCIAFYIECASYALVGFILNPRDIMKYVSLILLIAVYGNECFSGVHAKYAVYSKVINTEVQAMVGDKVAAEASKPENKQDNVAFRLPNYTEVQAVVGFQVDTEALKSENGQENERMHLEAGSEGYLKWRAYRLVLFLDKSDIPYIPKRFLFEIGKLNHRFCPGSIHLLYLKALLDFALIIAFLMFVFIVIFAFGQAYDISSSGQTIAALGSGFLPLVLRKFLFQTQSSTCVDKSNLKWKYMFANAVQSFETRWNFTDIHVTRIAENVDTKGVQRNDRPDNDNTAVRTVEETSVNLIPPSNVLTEDGLWRDIDLVVRSAMNSKEKEIITSFYVPRDLTVERRHADKETIV